MSRIKYIWTFLLLLLIGFGIYSNSLNMPFHYDDYGSIVDNPVIRVQKLNLESFKGIVSSERPVAVLSFAFNYYLNGLNLYGFHLFNIVVHILTATGLFFLLEGTLSLSKSPQIVERKFFISLLAVILWLTNPVQTQAVTYIVQRMAAMAAMFYVWCMWFYLMSRVSSSGWRYLYASLAILSAFLAFGAKQNALTLPVFILLYEIIIIRNGDISFLGRKKTLFTVVLFATVFLGLLWSLYYVSLAAPIGSWFSYWINTRILTGFRVIVFYVTELILPVPSRLSLEHDFGLSRSLFEPVSSFFTATAVCGTAIYAFASIRKYPLFSFFTLWFLGNLAIETFYPYLILIFEHRLYLPSMGFFAIAAIGIDKIQSSLKGDKLKRMGVSAILIILTFFAINTYIRNFTWKDDYSLWNDVIKKSPNISVGYVNLGAAYLRDENYGEASSSYLKALSVDPRNPVARYGLGVAYFNMQMYDKAISELSYLGSMGYISVGNDPSISYYFSRIAKNYYGHNHTRGALEVLEKALQYDPNEPMLKELKEKMEKGTITFEEIMRK